MSTFADLPKFDDLKDKKRYWTAKPGSREEGLGMLRYLTPEHVARVVKQEVQTGERVRTQFAHRLYGLTSLRYVSIGR